ncbi:MAG: ZIP family metal transporter, partial [Candidatus Sigynarchaeota archaeon]
ADRYNPKIKLDPSFIAGVVTSYFFLVVLPELAMNTPPLLVAFPTLQYAFIVVGLAFAHVSEKIILQKVKKRTREKAQKLIAKEKNLESVSERLSRSLLINLHNHAMTPDSSENMANEILALQQKEDELKGEIDRMKYAIQHSVGKSLYDLHEFTNTFYHFIIGIILIDFLMTDIAIALIFFTFSIVMALTNHVNNHMHVFSDLDIELVFGSQKTTRVAFALAAPLGIVVGFVTEFLFPMQPDISYYLFSFVSGALLYLIIREVLPDDEKGRPLQFVLGLAGFAMIIVIIMALQQFA